MNTIPEFLIDGNEFNSYKEFTEYFSNKFLPYRWNGGLDAFSDILNSQFGLVHEKYIIRWINSGRSREILGRDETINYYEKLLLECHPSNVDTIQKRLESFIKGDGDRIFDWLVDIIREQEYDGHKILLLE